MPIAKGETKFTWENKPPEEAAEDTAQGGQVMFGGCGVYYGPIRRRAVPGPKPTRRSIRSLLEFFTKKEQEPSPK